MIIIFCVVAFAMLLGGMMLYNHTRYEEAGVMIGVIGGISFLFSVITMIVLLVLNSNLSVIDERIAMYEEENARIEQQIADVVSQYIEHESNVFEAVTPESAVTLVSLYPELKSDTLVQQQIEMYMQNHDTILSLRDEKIGGGPIKWWLYFGG